GQHGGELAADGPAAHHGRRFRESLQVENLVTGEHELAVHLEAGDGAGHRSGRQQYGGSAQLGHGAISPLHPHDLALLERSGAGVGGDLALLEQALEPLVLALDDLALTQLGGREVDRPALDPDTELLGPLDCAVDGRRLQELLGRDASPVEASPPDLVLFHQGDAQARPAAIEGGGITRRPTPDDYDIKRLGRRDHHLSCRYQTIWDGLAPAHPRVTCPSATARASGGAMFVG